MSTNNDQSTRDRFIAYLDIQGFAHRVATEKHENIRKDLLSFRTKAIAEMETHARNTLLELDKNPSTQGLALTVIPVIFSDSILLVSWDESPLSLLVLLFRVQCLLDDAMSLGIPLKGAIAFGTFTADQRNSLYFGQPLIDAYHLQAEIQLYSVVLHHTVEKRMVITEKGHPYLVRYPNTPLDKGPVSHWLVMWSNADVATTQIEKFYTTVSGAARRYVDNTAQYAKWLTTTKH